MAPIPRPTHALLQREVQQKVRDFSGFCAFLGRVRRILGAIWLLACSPEEPLKTANLSGDCYHQRRLYRVGILAWARIFCQSSGVCISIQEMLWSRSAWLIESHWSSGLPPGKAKSSDSRSANQGARSGSIA